LVNPPVPGAYMGPIRPPVGLGYLAESLRFRGVEYDILDMTLGQRAKDLFKKVNEFKPDLIGLTLWTYMYKNTYRLIERISKACSGGISIAVGGPHVSTLREEVLGDCRAIDFGFVFEAEMALVEFCQGRELKAIKGLMHREGEKVIYNGDREFITDLDSFPFPRYEKFPMQKYFLKEILIVSSRGCPYSCIYCPVGLAIGKKLRLRSAGSVVDEIEYWYNKGYRKFNFGDDNFTFFKQRVYEICGQIEKRGLKGLDLRCGNGVRADKVDRPLLKRMRETGFSYLGLGVEAGNNRILKRIKKGETIEEIDRTIKDACELGYDVTLFFLAGSPGETRQDIMDSVKLATRYPVMDARFYNIVPYPGTELFAWIKEKSFFLRAPQDYLNDTSVFAYKPVFETPQLKAKERVRILKMLKSIEGKILRRAARRKLSKFGPLGAVLAFFASSRFFHFLLRHSKFVRSFTEELRYSLSRNVAAG